MKVSSFSLVSSFLAVLFFTSSGSGQSFQRSIHNAGTADIFAGDLNNDGKLDVMTFSLTTADTVTAFLNQGNGTFLVNGSVDSLIGGAGLNRMVATDINGDGILDVAVQTCTSGGDSVLIAFGNGDGTFTAVGGGDAQFPPFPASCLDALGVITLANNTLPSLLTSTLDRINILMTEGTPFFQQQQIIFAPAGVQYSGASTGDYNGDGLQDIAAVEIEADGVTRRVIIFYQKPDGTFNPPVPIFSSQDGLQFTHTVDLNGDSKGDLLVSFFGGPAKRAGVVALTNLGGGNFRSTILLADPLYTVAGIKPASVHPVGKLPGLRGIVLPLSPDPVVGGNSVFALFPAMGESWGKPIYFDDPGSSHATPMLNGAVVNGDFNADGRPDFAVIDNNDQMLVFLNTTTADTCAYPDNAEVRICSPAPGSTLSSLVAKIHASANAGALPVTAMKAYIDGTPVAESDMNALDASVTVKAGRHTLTVNAWDPNDKVYQSVVTFTAR